MPHQEADQASHLERRLRTHVDELATTIGERNVLRPSALHQAENYLMTVWEQQGYEVWTQPYTERGVRCANLQATRLGCSRTEEIILLGAHYDTVPGSPGANDNGSGVAALLEISRMFAAVEPVRTVRFVAFVNEEPPFFMTPAQGSMRYASEARRRGDDIHLMASLETIGYYRDDVGSQLYPPLFRWFYPDRGNFLAFVSNYRSRKTMRALAHAFRESCDFPLEHVATFERVPGVAWSDHYSFWRHRYRALMVTDTAPYRYPHYHSPDDTADKLDYGRLARVTDGLFRAFAEVSGLTRGSDQASA